MSRGARYGIMKTALEESMATPKKKVRGFEKNAAQIAKRQNISMDRARAVLAAGTRRASAAAKKRNPRLKRVKG